jgi:superfamily II DNA/RNA helicase
VPVDPAIPPPSTRTTAAGITPPPTRTDGTPAEPPAPQAAAPETAASSSPPGLPFTNFADFGLPHALVKALTRTGITSPTPVQIAVIPDALAGEDVLGRAATGSGKTLAFGLPLLVRLAGGRTRPKAPRALVVVPTRELASQVGRALEALADAVHLRVATVYGGVSYDRQTGRLRDGVDIVVATPGRLKDLIARGACTLNSVDVTVLDEADHLCDLGFFPAVSELVSMTPAGGQRLLLSATLDGDVDRLVRKHLTNPRTHACEPDVDKPDLDHHVLVTGAHDKLQTVAALLTANPRAIVFTRTRRGATNLARSLARLGVATVELHGNLSQSARERNLRRFRSGQADVVVATDVAARGIHVDGVALVVHYDAPTEQKAYLHRSGRTARAGLSGTVVTMTTTGQMDAVTLLQHAVGVRARHHDAGSAPSPMTVSSLARSGRPAANVTRRPAGRAATSGNRSSHAPKAGGRDAGNLAGSQRPRAGGQGRPTRGKRRFRGGDNRARVTR